MLQVPNSTLTHSKKMPVFFLNHKENRPDFYPDTLQGRGKSGEKSSANLNLSNYN